MNPINDEDEVSYPTPEWSGFRKETDKMSSLNVSQARMNNHQNERDLHVFFGVPAGSQRGTNPTDGSMLLA